MLIALRAILLVLFIAAPFGEQRTAADPHGSPAEFAIDAVLSCPETGRGDLAAATWTAAQRVRARPETFGDA